MKWSPIRRCAKCRHARALAASDWCRACWQTWWWAQLLDNKLRGASR